MNEVTVTLLPKLTKAQISALKSIFMSFASFEPSELGRFRSDVAEELVTLGFVERGECSTRHKELFGYEEGYRLTRAGRRLRLIGRPNGLTICPLEVKS